MSFGASLQPDSFDAMLRRAILMDELGFDHVWVPDHLVFLEWGGWCFDAWCVLSGFAVNTKRVRLGTSVSDPYRRHPAVFAQTIGTLDSISNGRAILGLGAGEAQNLLPYSIQYDEKVARMRECVTIMRRLWTGEMMGFDGRFYKLEKAFVQALPVQKPHPPIYIAANSPKTRELAGMIGDGWMAEMMTPKRYESDMEEVRRGAEKAERHIEDLDIAYHAPLSVSRDREEAWRMIRTLAKSLFLWWPGQLKYYGYNITQEFDWKHLTVKQDTGRKLRAQLDSVPDKVAEEITIFGTPDDCIEKIQRYIDAGVTNFVFFMELEDKSQAEKMLEIASKEIIPYFKENEGR